MAEGPHQLRQVGLVGVAAEGGAGRGRDAERIITADDGSAWYTDDHYRSFKQIRGPN